MANTYKILGQIATNAATETNLYTVPSSTSTVISSIVICNRGNTATTFRVSITSTNTATPSKDYLYYDVTLAGNDTFIATVGITLATTDKVRIYAGNANLSFNLFGTEITA
jgi:hypothetical protein